MGIKEENIMKKAYMTYHSGGSWEDYHEYGHKVFLDKENAEKFVTEYNEDLNKRQKHQREETSRFLESCNYTVGCDDDCDNCEYNFKFDYELDDEHSCMMKEVEMVE